MNREERQQEIDRLREEFLKGSNAYLVEFTGLKVGQVNDLRRKVRGASGSYRVVKNRLAMRAAEGTPLSGHAALFDGPTAVAFGADPVALAKVLAEFQKNNPIKVKGLVLEGKTLPATALEGIWKLLRRPNPPPVTRLAYWLSAQECTIDISRARAELGYEPVRTIEDGMEELRTEHQREAAAA